MSNNKAGKANSIYRVWFATLFTIIGIASCGGGSVADTPPDNPVINPPIVFLTPESTSVSYNGSTTISWSSTESTSCISPGGGGTLTTGSFNTGALTATKSFVVTCTGAGGSTSKSVTITVAPSSITGFADAGSGVVTVTTANTLINGSSVIISGTASYNGTYVISNVTPSSFSIVATYVADSSTTGVWKLTGSMISGCPTTTVYGTSGQINLSYNASRFNGVAPLSVFFDTVGTTTTVTTRPFHDMEYRWNFGDTTGSLSGPTWNEGSGAGVNSRNTATGPVAAHVYDTPGTYTVVLSATDGTNTVSNSCAQIVVQDPAVVFAESNTICVAATSTPVTGSGAEDCPADAQLVKQRSFLTAINTYAKTGKRVLFKRGDTFTVPSSASITTTGPGIVGAYGSGQLPKVKSSFNGTMLNLSSPTTPTIKDWRVMDIDFIGNKTYDSIAVELTGGINQVTLLRLHSKLNRLGIQFNKNLLDFYNDNSNPGHAIWDETAVVDSVITADPANNITSTLGTFLSGDHLFYAGNSIDLAGTVVGSASHDTRFTYLGKAVISNNTMSHPGPTEGSIKLHAPAWTSTGVEHNGVGGGYSRWIVISDNKFEAASNQWMVVTGPQNAESDERVRDVISERNWYVATPTVIDMELYFAYDVTTRNNIFDAGLSHGVGVYIGLRGIEPVANNVNIYNNSYYSSYANRANQISGVKIHADATNITVKNNLFYAPYSYTPMVVEGTGASGFSSSNNSTDAQMKSTSPLFTINPPVNPEDFKPTGSSYAIGGGATVPVWSDFFGNLRPQVGVSGTIDIGATEVP